MQMCTITNMLQKNIITSSGEQISLNICGKPLKKCLFLVLSPVWPWVINFGEVSLTPWGLWSQCYFYHHLIVKLQRSTLHLCLVEIKQVLLLFWRLFHQDAGSNQHNPLFFCTCAKCSCKPSKVLCWRAAASSPFLFSDMMAVLSSGLAV